VSKGHGVAAPIVVWSPTSVSWIDASHNLVTVDTLKDIAHQLPSREVLIAVSRRSTFIRSTRVPNTGAADIRRILQVQLGHLFPIPAQELAFDFHVTGDVSSEGRLVVVAAIRGSDLELLHAQAREAGLKISRVVPAAFSSPLLARSMNLDNAAVVHRTAEGLAIDLVVAGELRYSRVASMPATSLGIESEISRTFAAAVVQCSPTLAAGSLALPDADASTDRWATDLFDGAHLDVNIETAELRAKRERNSESGRLRIGLILFCGAAVFLGWQTMRFVQFRRAATGAGSRSAKELRDLADLSSAEQGKAIASNDLLKILDRSFHPGQSLADVVTIVANDVPNGVWLTAITADRGKPLILRGTSTNGNAVAAFQDSLINESQDSTHRFRDVKLVFANNAEVEKTPVVQFSISGFPVGNLPLVDLSAKKTGQKK
jgi:hypothetical protein